MTHTSNIVIMYPRLGWMDAFITDLPLSIIYVADECRRNGIDVRMIDQRVVGTRWRQELSSAVDQNTVLVGFSCMTGNPILHALKATRFVKQQWPNMPTVWGGHHVTICPHEALAEPSIDFIIRGHGSESLYALVRYLLNGKGNRQNIEGLGWMSSEGIRLNQQVVSFNFPPLNKLNLDLLNSGHYTRFAYMDRVYSLFTSFGCPHQCKFCFAPIVYKEVKHKRWFPYTAEEVIDHIVRVVKEFKIGYISLLDENFFLDLSRAERILNGIANRGIKVGWGIRGARIDDLDRADDAFFSLMAKVGVRQIMIGAESGSQRMLDIMKKGIKVDQTVRVNQRFAKYPTLLPSYNFLSGLPGETIEDLILTIDLIDRLMAENRRAAFSGLNQFIPFPGSDLYDACVKGGFEPPDTLEGWAFVDTHYIKRRPPWISHKMRSMLHGAQAALMFVDDKVGRELMAGDQNPNEATYSGNDRVSTNRSWALKLMYRIIILASKLYRPVAKYRLKKRYFKYPIDYKLIQLATEVLGRIWRLDNK